MCWGMNSFMVDNFSNPIFYSQVFILYFLVQNYIAILFLTKLENVLQYLQWAIVSRPQEWFNH